MSWNEYQAKLAAKQVERIEPPGMFEPSKPRPGRENREFEGGSRAFRPTLNDDGKARI